MATYQRSDLAFPVGAFDLFSMSEGSGVAQSDIPSLVLANLGTVIDALLAPGGTNIDLNLVDGTILRLTGTWTIGGTFLNPTASGSLTGVLRMTSGGDALETISNSSVPFDVSYDVLTPANSVFNFPTIAQTIAGNDTVLGGALNDYLKAFDGEDQLDGKGGNDRMAGGTGTDTYAVDSATDIIIEAKDAGIADRVNTTVNYTLAPDVEVEVLAAASAAASISINLTGNNLANKVIGNDRNNILDGGGDADELHGLGGDDTYRVDADGDQIVDTAGNDTVKALVSYTLAASVAVETLKTDNDTGTTSIDLIGNNLVNTVIGNAGDNTLNGGGAADKLQGLGGDDTYLVDDAGDEITDSDGDDTVNASVGYALAANVAIETLSTNNATATTVINLTGNNLGNSVIGNAGDNTLDGGGAADDLQGLGGNDTYVVDNALDKIADTAGADTVKASVNYVLAAGVAVETLRTINDAATTLINLTGNNLVNTVIGNAANNILDGGVAADTMQGLGGNDTYIVNSTGDVVTEALGGGIDLIKSSATKILAANVENLTLTGTAVINGTGNSLVNIINGNTASNILDGGAGADRLIGGGGNDTYVVDSADVVVDVSGIDTCTSKTTRSLLSFTTVEKLTLSGTAAINGTGNALANTITGNGAANILDGGAGVDILKGGAGNDTYVLSNGTDKVADTAGIDTITSTVTRSLATFTTIEKLTLLGTAAAGTGNGLANTITGNGAANILDGGAGVDILKGGAGNDTYVLSNGTDKVTDTAGIDTITSTMTRSLATFTTIEKLTLLGTAATGTGNGLANTITGNGANNKLSGMVGNDILLGGIGSDVLVGGVGKDTMTGGTGLDDFDFNLVTEMGKTAATRDVIKDFALGDDIDLSTIDANGAALGHTFSFLAAKGAAFTGVAGQLRWFQENPIGLASDKTIVAGDINGDRVADFQIELTGLKALTAADFVL